MTEQREGDDEDADEENSPAPRRNCRAAGSNGRLRRPVNASTAPAALRMVTI